MNAVKAFLQHHKVELKFGLRVTIAAVAALVVALLLHLKLPLWAVMTAVVVTQSSVGGSLKASRDNLVGTLGGALYGGAIAILVPHSGEGSLLLVLVLIVAPLSFLAALNPAYGIATMTALIVLLLPTITQESPLDSAIERVLEVAVGAVVGLLVTFLVMPARAHDQIRSGAANVLDALASTLDQLLTGAMEGTDTPGAHSVLSDLGTQLNSLVQMAGAADRERMARLAAGPDPGPLLRTMARLRNDFVMIERTDAALLPADIRQVIHEPLDRVRQTMTTQLRAAATSLRGQEPPPSTDGVTSALALHAEAVAMIRQQGLTRNLATEVVEHFFALQFTLEQIERNLGDLQRCVAQWAAPSAG